jgi:hypothetical protein
MLFIQSLNFVLWPEQKEKQAVCILQVMFTATERRRWWWWWWWW